MYSPFLSRGAPVLLASALRLSYAPKRTRCAENCGHLNRSFLLRNRVVVRSFSSAVVRLAILWRPCGPSSLPGTVLVMASSVSGAPLDSFPSSSVVVVWLLPQLLPELAEGNASDSCGATVVH